MELRDRITNEGTKQFFQYGIRNVTMDDIAVSLGISKRTVYETFKDKSELVQNCIEVLNHKQDKRVNEVVSQSENAIKSIFVFMREGMRVMNEINPVFFKDMEKLYPSLWKKIEKEALAKRYNLSSKLLTRGVSEGLFREDLNIDIVAKLFHTQLTIFSDETVFPRDKYNHAEIFQNMIINFTRGISTLKGIEIIDNTIL
ncbi:MAG: TetR/AcrR family transcriptional regulator [Prolixibacteraceae bacterium]|nr:TetR/AcrR family transcriptional regulator [Prolixibacteraceae bacterium]